jgi:hypothetical protein
LSNEEEGDDEELEDLRYEDAHHAVSSAYLSDDFVVANEEKMVHD